MMFENYNQILPGTLMDLKNPSSKQKEKMENLVMCLRNDREIVNGTTPLVIQHADDLTVRMVAYILGRHVHRKTGFGKLYYGTYISWYQDNHFAKPGESVSHTMPGVVVLTCNMKPMTNALHEVYNLMDTMVARRMAGVPLILTFDRQVEDSYIQGSLWVSTSDKTGIVVYEGDYK